MSTRGGTVLVDSNVLLDVLTEDPVWYAWSLATLAAAADQSSLAINPLVYAEVSIGFERIEELEEALPPETFPCSRDSASKRPGSRQSGSDYAKLGALSKIMQLQNRVALVTGASRGGGKRTARSGRDGRGGPRADRQHHMDTRCPHGHAFYEVVKNATNKLVRETPATPSSRRPRA